MSNPVTSSSIKKAIAGEPAPPVRIESRLWEDTPAVCVVSNCEGTNFSGQQLDGGFLWKCNSCQAMWAYPFRARKTIFFTVSEGTITPLGIADLPNWKRVTPTPPGGLPEMKPEIKPEPKRR